MRRSSFLVGLVPAVAFAAVMFGSTKEAAAGPHLDLDLNLGTALQGNRAANASKVDFSFGGGARVGYRVLFPRSIVWLQPELGGHYMRFGTNSNDVGFDYAGMVNGGLRLGIGGIVQPHIFGHLGLGFLGFNRFGGGVEGYIGPQTDIGVGLDIRIVRGFTLGAQVAYNTVSILTDDVRAPQYSAKWFSFGISAGFHFGQPAARRVYYR